MSDVQEAPHKVKKYDILRPDSGPEYKVVIKDSPRRVRAVFNGETVADSVRMKMMHETKHLPVYYFPVDDVRMDLLEMTDHKTHCPHVTRCCIERPMRSSEKAATMSNSRAVASFSIWSNAGRRSRPLAPEMPASS